MTNQEIAKRLDIAPRTVEKHVERLLAHFDISSRFLLESHLLRVFRQLAGYGGPTHASGLAEVSAIGGEIDAQPRIGRRPGNVDQGLLGRKRIDNARGSQVSEGERPALRNRTALSSIMSRKAKVFVVIAVLILGATVLRETGTISTDVYSSRSTKSSQFSPAANYTRFAFDGVKIRQVREFQPQESPDRTSVEVQVIMVGEYPLSPFLGNAHRRAKRRMALWRRMPPKFYSRLLRKIFCD